MDNDDVACHFQELMRLYIKSEQFTPTVDRFHHWAATDLKTPRSVWLYSMCVSAGSLLVVLRAAIRYLEQ